MAVEVPNVSSNEDAGAICLNCGQAAGPRYCGRCGQAVDDRRSPMLALLRELLEEGLSVDGRLLSTLRVLPLPGRITRLYLDGKRVRFLNPLRLYLFASVLLFSSLLTLRPPKVGDVNFYIGDVLIGHEHVVGRPTITARSPDFGLSALETPGMRDLETRLRSLPPQEALDRLFNGMRDALPVGLFLFVPVLALVLKALYVRSRILYVDHLIFAVHFQSALFLILSAIWLVLRIFGVGFLPSVLVYLPVALLMLTLYLGWALRCVYRQSRWKTAVKTAVLLFAYLVMLRQAIGIPVIFILSRM